MGHTAKSIGSHYTIHNFVEICEDLQRMKKKMELYRIICLSYFTKSGEIPPLQKPWKPFCKISAGGGSWRPRLPLRLGSAIRWNCCLFVAIPDFALFNSFFQEAVPEEGVEPSRGCPHRILSPARLPFHHSGRSQIYILSHNKRVF